MLVYELIVALVIALLIGSVFASCRRCGPWQGVGWFFLLVFLFTWTGGVWVAPFGPVLFGVHWVPFLWFGLMLALLLAAVPPPTHPTAARSAEEEEAVETREVVTATVGVTFWLLILGLIAALMVHYVS